MWSMIAYRLRFTRGFLLLWIVSIAVCSDCTIDHCDCSLRTPQRRSHSCESSAQWGSVFTVISSRPSHAHVALPRLPHIVSLLAADRPSSYPILLVVHLLKLPNRFAWCLFLPVMIHTALHTIIVWRL